MTKKCLCSPSSHYMWCDTLFCCFVYTSLWLAFVSFGFTPFFTFLCEERGGEGGEGAEGRGDSGLVGVVMTRQRFMLVHAFRKRRHSIRFDPSLLFRLSYGDVPSADQTVLPQNNLTYHYN